MKYLIVILFLLSTTLFGSQGFTKLVKKNTVSTYVLNTKVLLHSSLDKSSIDIHLDEINMATFVYKKMITRVQNEDYTWMGVNAANPYERLRATYKSGVFYISFTHQSFRYSIEYLEGDYYLTKFSQLKALNRGDDGILLPTSSSLLRSSAVQAASASIDENADVNINILVRYTKNFETTYGAGVDAFIQGMFDDANDALNSSLTKVTLVNVHTELLDTALTSESYTIGTALSQLSDASLSMQVKRSLYEANLVTLFRVYSASGQPCGLAYVPASIDSRVDINSLYSVIEVGSVGGAYCVDLTFAHEVGHNFGCAHNRAEGGAGLYTYSHGYDIAGTFATVMSYETPGIAFFSNPDLSDVGSGLPIGLAEGDPNSADCSKTIRRSKLAIANNTTVSEPLESGDIQTDYHIEGSLIDNDDRDSYSVRLSGITQFNGSNPKYSNWAYFLNLYDQNNHYIGTYSDNFSLDLSSGFYTIIFSDSSDENSAAFGDTVTEYVMDIITTELSAPIITITSTQSTDEDTNLSIVYDINSLEALSLDFDQNTTHGSLSVNSTHITYVPDVNYFGTDSFIISVTDSNLDSDSAEVNITVVGINDDPSLDIVSSLNTNEDNNASLSFTLSDIEDNDGDLILELDVSNTNGSVTIVGNSVVYTPSENYNGNDSFKVSTTDSSGSVTIQTIMVTVNSVNDVPLISILESFETPFNTPKIFTYSAQDDDNDSVSLSISSSPKHGSVTLVDSAITYSPTDNYVGLDSFILLFSDNQGGNINKTIGINVLAEVITETNTTSPDGNTTIPDNTSPTCIDQNIIISEAQIFYNECDYALENGVLKSSALSIETEVSTGLEIDSQLQDSHINFKTNMINTRVELKEAGAWKFSTTELFANSSALELVYELDENFKSALSHIVDGVRQTVYHLRAFDSSALENQEVKYTHLSNGSVDVETTLTLPSSGLIIE